MSGVVPNMACGLMSQRSRIPGASRCHAWDGPPTTAFPRTGCSPEGVNKSAVVGVVARSVAIDTCPQTGPGTVLPGETAYRGFTCWLRPAGCSGSFLACGPVAVRFRSPAQGQRSLDERVVRVPEVAPDHRWCALESQCGSWQFIRPATLA